MSYRDGKEENEKKTKEYLIVYNLKTPLYKKQTKQNKTKNKKTKNNTSLLKIFCRTQAAPTPRKSKKATGTDCSGCDIAIPTTPKS